MENEQTNSVGVISTRTKGNGGVAMATNRDSEAGTKEMTKQDEIQEGIYRNGTTNDRCQLLETGYVAVESLIGDKDG